jgi:hypothetical protein
MEQRSSLEEQKKMEQKLSLEEQKKWVTKMLGY